MSDRTVASPERDQNISLSAIWICLGGRKLRLTVPNAPDPRVTWPPEGGKPNVGVFVMLKNSPLNCARKLSVKWMNLLSEMSPFVLIRLRSWPK